jgi:hypothetical protein
MHSSLLSLSGGVGATSGVPSASSVFQFFCSSSSAFLSGADAAIASRWDSTPKAASVAIR